MNIFYKVYCILNNWEYKAGMIIKYKYYNMVENIFSHRVSCQLLV